MINPLPKRFHNETFKPHLLVRKNHKKSEQLQKCSHDMPRKRSLELESHSVIKYKRVKRSTINAVENPVFIETAVFVDKDLFDHMKSNFPADTERELIRFVLAMINAVSIKTGWLTISKIDVQFSI